MKLKNLKSKIWFYLSIFAGIILLFLWFFQILFLNKFYELTKRKTVEDVSKEIKTHYNDEEYLSKLSFEKQICIQITKNEEIIYSSTNYNRGCILDNNHSSQYFDLFKENSRENQTYNIINPRFKNQTILKGIKIDSETFVFVSTSLMPLDSSIKILKQEFIFVALIVLVLAFLVGYFISKKLSDPLVKMNKAAKKLAKGNFDVTFDIETDIEEMNDLSKTLTYTKNELSKLEELRRDLLANVGHDLKTPLTMIKAYAEMVRDITYKDDQKREENLNIIIDETDRLTVLIEDIIELSKMQSAKEELSMEKIKVHEMIQSVLKRYEILSETEGYKFIYENNKEYTVLGNQKRIEQVLFNLINNAINYTGKDKKVFILLDEENDKIKISIKDTGNGIKEEDIPYIWDKYYHNSKKHKRNKVGTGIGLSIVKSVLEKHDVEYGVTSNHNGSIFYFYLKKEDSK